MVEEFFSRVQGLSAQVATVSVEGIWKPLAQRKLAINVDVSIGEGHCVFAMIVRDSGGKLVFFGLHWSLKLEPQHAELEALVWAVKVAVGYG